MSTFVYFLKLECGPEHALTNFTRRMRFENVQVHNVENDETLQKTTYRLSEN